MQKITSIDLENEVFLTKNRIKPFLTRKSHAYKVLWSQFGGLWEEI